MSKVIIYPQEAGHIACVFPNMSCGISLEEIAKKDVPAGVPYLIVDESALPAEFGDYCNAWEADFSNPDGYGIGSEVWLANKAAEDAAKEAAEEAAKQAIRDAEKAKEQQP